MLSPLDETLRHVLPTTFDHAGTSDPRFFDRYWFAIYDPEGGEPALNMGMCSYLNMNVVDGYAAFIVDGRQHNIRFSRVLRPELFEVDPNLTAIGPLSVQIIEPFRRLRLRLDENEWGLGFDLEWAAGLPPHEELPNFSRIRGRANQDYIRYNQSGTVNGWLQVDGKRTEASGWWGGRDHSWGVRTDIAGGEPVTGPGDDRSSRGGFLWTWITFGAQDMAGHVQYHEIEDGTPVHEDGMLRWADGRVVVANSVRLDFDVYPGTKRFSKAVWHLGVNSGPDAGTWRVEATPISRSLSMLGLGYSMGYTDRKGFGVYRGENHVEHDIYDVSHDEDVVMPDGTADRPYHRDCAVTFRVVAPDGTVYPGAGHVAIIPSGTLEARGIQ
jgi:hypothetical protein